MKSTRHFRWPAGAAGMPRRARIVVGLAAAIGAAASTAACHRAAPRPDVLLVTIDTLRRDHCSLYGYPVPTTPNLDALASRGVRFERAYAESATTAPSHAVLMTGRHFRTLGVTKNGAVVSDEDVTLAEALRDAGYRTAAFVSSYPLTTRFGFAQGFETYDDRFDVDQASVGRRKEGVESRDRFAGATVDHLESWLESPSDNRPLFLWVHFVDPHAPYRAPEPFEAQWPDGTLPALRRYDGEVHYADRQLGRLLAVLDARRAGRERLTVVTSDHGEGLGDHGWMSHGINLHEEAVRVPLAAEWPGRLDAGRVVDGPVGLVDVAPGILGLLGVDASSFAHGLDLFAAADGNRAIFLQRRGFRTTHEKGVKIGGSMTAVVRSGTKFIVAPAEGRKELYDLQSDPGELVDLLGSAPRPARRKRDGQAPSPAAPVEVPAARVALASKLEKELAAWRKAHPEAPPRDKGLDKETRQALRSLGYVD